MITVSQKVGRLAEIRVTAPITVEEIALMQREMVAILNRFQGRVVVCTDLSGASVFSTDQVSRIARFLRADNTRLERNALVVGDSPTLLLQLDRVIREGNAPALPTARAETPPSRDQPSARTARGSDPHMSKRSSERRTFRSPQDAMTWLDEILTPEERARLRAFMAPPRNSP